jgi:heterodisulfide reductase subunit B
MENGLSSILYPQLLGLSMGMEAEEMGIGRNRMDISGIMSFLYNPNEKTRY